MEPQEKSQMYYVAEQEGQKVDFWQDPATRGKRILSFDKMKKSHRWGVLCATFLLAISMVVLPAYGDDEDLLAQFKKEQAELQKELAAQKKELQAAKNKENQYRNELSQVEAEMASLEKEMASVEKKLTAASQQITKTTKELDAKEKDLAERMELFQNRMREIYMNGEVTMMDVIFDSTSFSDFLIRYELWGRVMTVDKEMLEQIEAEKQVIEEKKAVLEKNKATLESLKQQKATSLANLDTVEQQKMDLVAAAEKDKAAAQKMYDEMEAESNAIAKKIQALQPKGDGGYNGVFQWPLPGYTRVSSDYVLRMHPTLHVKKWHTGIDLPAPKGTKIVAAADGKVIFTGWNNAYGNMVIIDHGNGLSSLYGHMSKITMKTNGQQVKKGDKVGEVGTTGYSTGNHLHFETRVNGAHTSPWPYLK